MDFFAVNLTFCHLFFLLKVLNYEALLAYLHVWKSQVLVIWGKGGGGVYLRIFFQKKIRIYFLILFLITATTPFELFFLQCPHSLTLTQIFFYFVFNFFLFLRFMFCLLFCSITSQWFASILKTWVHLVFACFHFSPNPSCAHTHNHLAPTGP